MLLMELAFPDPLPDELVELVSDRMHSRAQASAPLELPNVSLVGLSSRQVASTNSSAC
jgi:hypothetical protein